MVAHHRRIGVYIALRGRVWFKSRTAGLYRGGSRSDSERKRPLHLYHDNTGGVLRDESIAKELVRNAAEQ
jgi:hypothetical protein